MRALALRAGAIAVLVAGLAACGQAPAPAPGGGASPVSSRPAPSSTAATTARAPSATGQLAPFVAAAGQADGQLRHAAGLVNGEIGSTSMRFTPATLAAIRDLSTMPAARAIPAGLPAGLLRAVLVVYGDLASRRAAFGGIERYGHSGELTIGRHDANEVLRGLHNGAPAAARYGADLAAMLSLAQQTPPLSLALPDSRDAAELALRLSSIDKHNGCSDLFGGYAPAVLESVVWHSGAGERSGHYEGTIDTVRFEADYGAEHGWEINIHAC